MEYTYKNSPSARVCTVVLNQYNMVVQSAENNESIHYANITNVRLSRLRNGYKVVLTSDTHIPITITNRFYLSNGEYEDLSHTYHTFVRVLHYHLKDKSPAIYTSGCSLNNLVVWSLVSAFISFFISFISEYLGVSLMNSIIQAIMLTLIIVAIIITSNKNHLPRSYTPEEIPLKYLPDFWK